METWKVDAFLLLLSLQPLYISISAETKDESVFALNTERKGHTGQHSADWPQQPLVSGSMGAIIWSPIEAEHTQETTSLCSQAPTTLVPVFFQYVQW